MIFFNWITEGQKLRQGFNFRVCKLDSLLQFRLKIIFIGILIITLRRRNKFFYSKGVYLTQFPRWKFIIQFQSDRLVKQRERWDRGNFDEKIEAPIKRFWKDRIWIQI